MGEVRFTLRQLQYFIAVAELGTITEAAQRCVVSQTAVSLALGDLERMLGTQLLKRQRSRGVTLTTAGQALLGPARSLHGQAEELQSIMAHGGTAICGPLAVGCYTTISPIVMPALIEQFRRAHPAVTMSLAESSQPDLSRELMNHTIDVAIMYDSLLDPELAKVTLAEVHPHVILAESHPMAAYEAVSLKELAREPMILFDVTPSRENWTSMMSAFDLDPIVAYRTQSFETTRTLVSRNLGYAVLFQRPRVSETYDSGRVVVRPISESVTPHRVVAAHPRSTRLTARVREFIRHAQQSVPDLL